MNKTNQMKTYVITGIGLQELVHPDCFISASVEGKQVDWSDVAKNDGLLFEDFLRMV